MTSKYFLSAIGVVLIITGILLAKNWSVSETADEVAEVSEVAENQDAQNEFGDATGSSTLNGEPTSTTTLQTELIDDPLLESKIAGIYVSNEMLSSATSGQYRLELQIATSSESETNDKTAVLTSEGGDATINQTGVWRLEEINGRTNIVIYFDVLNGAKVDLPKKYHFIFDEQSVNDIDVLNSSVIDVAYWGSSGLKLNRQN